MSVNGISDQHQSLQKLNKFSGYNRSASYLQKW